jgi:Tfp pilus assembly protein PilN
LKTIEINLIGDLRQKQTSRKMGPLPEKFVPAGVKPEEAQKNMYLWLAGGSAGLAILVLVLVIIGSFTFNIYTDSQIAKVEDEINQKQIELNRYKKIKKELEDQKLSLVIKKEIKGHFMNASIPLADILEELRAKVPDNIYLTEVTKSAKGVQIKGSVAKEDPEPLKSITLFVINLNSIKPEASIISDASLVSASQKNDIFNFTIVASSKKPVTVKNN